MSDNKEATTSVKRMHWMDNLRTFIIFLVSSCNWPQKLDHVLR